MSKRLNGHVSEADRQTDRQKANKHTKGCSTSLIIRNIHSKSPVRNHRTPTLRTTIKQMNTQEVSTVGEDVEKLEPLDTFKRNVKCCSHCGTYGKCSKN